MNINEFRIIYFELIFSEFFGRINKILNQVDDEPLKLWLGPFLLIGLKKPEYLEVSEN